jgi:hypothetical protein
VIISEHQVLTVAHCLENSTLVAYGAGRSEAEVESPSTQQVGLVTGVRIDPDFSGSSVGDAPGPDDIAVAEVLPGFTFDTAVAPIALAPLGSRLPEGTELNVTGFGQHTASPELEPGYKLYSLKTTLVADTMCGGEAFLCTRTSSGSTCFGDSGSGLTRPGTPVTLVGLVDRVESSTGETCAANTVDAFVNVTAPAIREFIEGKTTTTTTTTSSTTSTSSRTTTTTTSTTSRTTTTTTSTTTQPTTTTTTTSTTSTASQNTVKVPVSGQSQEQGQGTSGTPARSAVRAVASSLSASNGSAVVDLDCAGTATCRGTLTLTATQTKKVKGKRRKVSVTIGTESFSIAGGSSAKVKVKLSSYARAQLKATHGHLHASLSLLGRETEPTSARIENVTIL